MESDTIKEFLSPIMEREKGSHFSHNYAIHFVEVHKNLLQKSKPKRKRTKKKVMREEGRNFVLSLFLSLSLLPGYQALGNFVSTQVLATMMLCFHHRLTEMEKDNCELKL